MDAATKELNSIYMGSLLIEKINSLWHWTFSVQHMCYMWSSTQKNSTNFTHSERPTKQKKRWIDTKIFADFCHHNKPTNKIHRRRYMIIISFGRLFILCFLHPYPFSHRLLSCLRFYSVLCGFLHNCV